MKKYITPEGTKIVITPDNRVFYKTVKKASPKAMNCNGVTGGTWKEKSAYDFKYISIVQWLTNVSATESDFKGLPRIK